MLHPDRTVRDILKGLEDCRYWPYVEGVLPILADALEEAGDQRAGEVRTFTLIRQSKWVRIPFDDVIRATWDVFTCQGKVRIIASASERQATAESVRLLQYWLMRPSLSCGEARRQQLYEFYST